MNASMPSLWRQIGGMDHRKGLSGRQWWQKQPFPVQVKAVASEFVNKVNSHSSSQVVQMDGKSPKLLAGPQLPVEEMAPIGPTPLPLLSVANQRTIDTAVHVIAAALLAAMEKQKKKSDQAALQRGILVQNGLVYRQTFAIRSYEVGFDKAASIETIANLFQETALNHVRMSDFVGDGMGTTHAMMKHRLIWVVTRMHVEVVRYPVWGDVVLIDSWVKASGKNGMGRDFLVRDHSTGEVLVRATSNWAMMNQDTRKLSKMPGEVRAEIFPYFIDRYVMEDEHACQRICKLDNSAPFVKNDLMPKLHDIDMNQHVNHVKYIGWVLESVPETLLVEYELASMTLEYRKECGPSDTVSSLTKSDSDSDFNSESNSDSDSDSMPLHYTHLLRMQHDGTEILRGRTEWKLKQC